MLSFDCLAADASPAQVMDSGLGDKLPRLSSEVCPTNLGAVIYQHSELVLQSLGGNCWSNSCGSCISCPFLGLFLLILPGSFSWSLVALAFTWFHYSVTCLFISHRGA